MPELPEVEVVRQSLDKKIKQKKVKKVIVRNRNLRFRVPVGFENFLKNKRVLKVGRFSKFLILHLCNEKYCLIHMGMSGTIHLKDNKKKKSITNTSFYNSPFLPKKHNHVEISFGNFRLIYNDPRRFGFFQIIKKKSLLKKKFNNLGPEPFQSKFCAEYVYSFFNKKKKNIKNFLLDQKFVSGIGNIYASEILFFCKIKPHKEAFLLKKKDCKKIVFFSKEVLNYAIRRGGSSIRDFKNILGSKGNFQKDFKVYNREGLNCKRLKCNGIIKKKIISNRSTFFCDC
jgi:formamidopyrimidine-DNA glycosylase